MNIGFYGKGKLGKKAYDYLRGAEDINVLCTCEDSHLTDETGRVVFADVISGDESVPAANIQGMGSVFASGLIDAVIVATDNELLGFVVKRLLDNGIDRIAVLPSYYEDISITDSSFMWVETDKPRLPYLEYHISFQCNLKCSGCTHFSNIIKEPRFGNFEQFCNDMKRLQELFWGVGKIRLMGGEPVLNPALPDFIYASREAFPDADIRVVSNGLMLRKEHKELFEAMREMAVYFDVSMYPPTVNSIKNIAALCNENGVKLTVTPEIKEFTAGMNLSGAEDPAASYRACPAAHCAYLCDSKISTCAMPQLIDIYNEHFGLDIKAGDSDVTDLYEEGLTGEALLKRLRSPMEICRHCDVNRRAYEWHVSADPDKSEWIGAV